MSDSALRTVAAKAMGSRGFDGVVRLLERLDRPRAGRLAVLMYHRVAEPDEAAHLDPGLISATPGEFEAQARYLAATGRVVSLEQLLAARRGQATLPPGAVAITFDDAYRDFADHAWPALRRYGLPATLFVPTGFPDRPERAFWWDRLHHALGSANGGREVETPVGRLTLGDNGDRRRAFTALRDHLKRVEDAEARRAVDVICAELDPPPAPPPVLGWDELRTLAGEGLALAPHTRSHAFLDQVSAEQAREEVAGSRADLERELGAAPPVFAYPAGQHSDEVVRILGEEGYEIAFTTARGVNDLRRPEWLRLMRINIGGRSTLPVIRAQLLSFVPRMSG